MSQTEAEIELRQYAIAHCDDKLQHYRQCNYPDDEQVKDGMTVGEHKAVLTAKAAQWRQEVRELQEGVRE